MSLYGSQRGLHNLCRRTGSRSDIVATSYPISRAEVVHDGNGYGQEYAEDYGYTFSRGSMGAGQG